MLSYNVPSDFEYALLSQHVYKGNTIQQDDDVPDNKNWYVHSVQSGARDYFGAIYVNLETKQVVVAHRGTPGLKILLTEDIQAIYLNWDSPQKHEAFLLIEKALKYAKKKDFHLSFTGHSLGAFLAELSVYYCHRSSEFTTANAVTFESPGARKSIEKLLSNHNPLLLDQLDIISYLSYPNIINTCNLHVGTLYSLQPDLGAHSWRPDWYTIASHSIDNIVKLLRDNKQASLITDWPLGSQLLALNPYLQFKNGYYYILQEEDFAKANQQRYALDYKGHYGVDATLHSANSKALKHFPVKLQEFLTHFYSLLQRKILQDQNRWMETWQNEQALPSEVISCLLGFHVIKQGNGELLCKLHDNQLTIHQFKHIITIWFEQSGINFIDLLKPIFAANKDESFDVLVAITAPGAIVKGTIENSSAHLAVFEYPQGTSYADIDKMQKSSNEFLQQIKEAKVKTAVYGMAPGSILAAGGKMSNIEVSATKHKITPGLANAQSPFSSSASSLSGNVLLPSSTISAVGEHAQKKME